MTSEWWKKFSPHLEIFLTFKLSHVHKIKSTFVCMTKKTSLYVMLQQYRWKLKGLLRSQMISHDFFLLIFQKWLNTRRSIIGNSCHKRTKNSHYSRRKIKKYFEVECQWWWFYWKFSKNWKTFYPKKKHEYKISWYFMSMWFSTCGLISLWHKISSSHVLSMCSFYRLMDVQHLSLWDVNSSWEHSCNFMAKHFWILINRLRK